MLITVDVAAAELAVKPARLYCMARQGILPLGVVVRFGRQLRIDAAALRTWLAAGGSALPGGWRR
ncbi:MAG: helix-turn-helix domain-containing protein [Bryobacteraceae bacterium]